MGWENILAFLGGATAGYGQAELGKKERRFKERQQSETERAAAARDKQFQDQLAASIEQANRDAGIRETRNQNDFTLGNRGYDITEKGQDQGNNLQTIGLMMRLSDLAKGLRTAPPRYAAGVSNAVTGALKIPNVELNPSDELPLGRDPQEDALRAETLIKGTDAILKNQELGVGKTPVEQGQIGTMNTMISDATGAPRPFIPFAPTGEQTTQVQVPQFEDVLGGLLAGRPQDATPRLSTRDDTYPGYSPSPATQETQSRARFINSQTDQQEAETKSIPEKLRLKRLEIMADVKRYGMQYAMEKYRRTRARSSRS
jgi:hypothetical protein